MCTLADAIDCTDCSLIVPANPVPLGPSSAIAGNMSAPAESPASIVHASVAALHLNSAAAAPFNKGVYIEVYTGYIEIEVLSPKGYVVSCRFHGPLMSVCMFVCHVVCSAP